MHLYISCEANVSPDVLEFVSSIAWTHGTLEIIRQPIQLGVDAHNLACMRLAEELNHIVVLEDDMTVAPYFQAYLEASMPLVEQKNIAGISLYRYPIIEQDHFPFQLLPNDEFTYYQQRPSSKGCFYSWAMLKPYFDFLETFEQNYTAYELPQNVLKWSNEIWEKSFYCYLIQSNSYLAFPRFSLSTDFADVGVHMKKQTLKYVHQSPLYLSVTFSHVKSMEDTYNVFDAFYEILPNKLKLLNPELALYDFSTDLHGHKPLAEITTPYLISSKSTENAKLGWERRLKPEINNVVLHQKGTFYSLAATDSFKAKKPNQNLKEKFLYYYPDTKLTHLIRMKLAEVWSRYFG
jgi:hypothetical protein